MNNTVKLSTIEIEAIVAKAVKDSGFTVRELEEQAKINRFETLSAKLAWMAVSAQKNSNK